MSITKNTLIAILSLAAMPAVAEPFVHEELDSSDHNEVNVRLFDNAVDGCWTNIGEVRTYAEDSLAEAGYDVVPEDEATFDFDIYVWAYRPSGGRCFGTIEIKLTAGGYVEPLKSYARAVVASTAGLPSGYPKLNNLILDKVGELTKAIRKE